MFDIGKRFKFVFLSLLVSVSYGSPQVSQEKRKALGKRKKLVAEENCSRQKRNRSRQKKKTRGKRKNVHDKRI